MVREEICLRFLRSSTAPSPISCTHARKRSFCTLAVAVAHLVYTVESILHTFDGVVLAVLDVLRLEHLAEGALSFLGYQPVLSHLSLLAAAAAAVGATNVSAPDPADERSI